MNKPAFNYAPGDQVQDLRFDPPTNGVVIAPHSKTPNAYLVRLEGRSADEMVRAHNLRMAD